MGKRVQNIPFDFVIEELASVYPMVKPMFGSWGLYVGDKIVVILRNRPNSSPRDNGLWIATVEEHHPSLEKDFPSIREIEIFRARGPKGWRVLPMDAEDFEESVFKLCDFIRRGDERLGKVPQSKLKARKSGVSKPAKQRPSKRKASVK